MDTFSGKEEGGLGVKLGEGREAEAWIKPKERCYPLLSPVPTVLPNVCLLGSALVIELVLIQVIFTMFMFTRSLQLLPCRILG